MPTVREQASVTVESTPLPSIPRNRPSMRYRPNSSHPLVRRAHPLALRRAVELAGGDYSRLHIDPEDNSVIVLNDRR